MSSRWIFILCWCYSFGPLQHKKKIEELLKLGNLSVLCEKTEPNPKLPHSYEFGERQDDVCVAYGRDRGETGTEARIRTLQELYDADCIDYIYIFSEDNEWKYHYYKFEDMSDFRSVKGDLNKEYEKLRIKRPEGFYGFWTDGALAEERKRQASSGQGAEM